MRKLTINTFITLDGVMQAPGGPEEDPSGNFRHGGWSVNYWDEMMGRIMDEFMGKPFDMLLGRRTYEIFAAHWPYIKDDPAANALNGAKKYVASKTLKSLEWANSTLIKGDVVKSIQEIKAGSGPEIQVHGSGNLIQTLLKHNLIDELRLWIFPVSIGNGKRLFGEGTVPANFRLLESRASTTGVIITRYEPAGELKTGTFALEHPTEAELARRKKHAD